MERSADGWTKISFVSAIMIRCNYDPTDIQDIRLFVTEITYWAVQRIRPALKCSIAVHNFQFVPHFAFNKCRLHLHFTASFILKITAP